MTLGSKPRGSEFVGWKSDVYSRHSGGIQVVFELEPKRNWKPVFHRRDELERGRKAV
jgi:hypothetical protein